MRLTWKLTAILMSGLLAVFVATAVARVTRELAMFEEDTRHDANLVASALARASAYAWRAAGERAALDVVSGASRVDGRVTARWVWLRSSAAEHRPAVPLPERDRPAPEFVLSREGAPSEDVLYCYVPLAVDDPRMPAIEVRRSLGDERRFVHRTVERVAGLTFAALAVSGVLALALGARLVARPVQRMIHLAQAVGAGDLSARLDGMARDELGQLGDELNAMVQRLADARVGLEAETRSRLAAVEQLRHADRLATAGKLAAGVAHELGTPLNVVEGRAQLILARADVAQETADDARIVVEQSRRMTAIIRQLLDFSRGARGSRSVVDVGGPIQRAVQALARLAENSDVTLAYDAPVAPVKTMLDPVQFEQVITNLVVNAIQAMPRGGLVRIAVDLEERMAPAGGPVGTWVRIAVCDTGVGIAPEHLPHVFEPFFTTKDVGEGTGLGLSVIHGIVADHGGWVEVSSAPGEGSTFMVRLPAGSFAPM